MEVQVKGCYATPFSRGFDGRATLRGCLREMIGSEGLHALGVPSQRVTSVISTGEVVSRPWYPHGSPASRRKYAPRVLMKERGATLTRVAPSFLRLGHFELHHARSESALLSLLVEHAFATTSLPPPPSGVDPAEHLVSLVPPALARLSAEWLRVGYAHGNINTDNVPLLGYALDLGPCAFMEKYDRFFQPFTSDGAGAYAFCNQPTALLQAVRTWSTAVLDDREGWEEKVSAQRVAKRQAALMLPFVRVPPQTQALFLIPSIQLLIRLATLVTGSIGLAIFQGRVR